MEKQKDTWLQRRGIIFIHVLIWCIVFAVPAVFIQRDGVIHWRMFFGFLPIFISFLLVFYLNYFYLVDKLLFRRKRTYFFLVNILVIVGFALLLHFWHQIEFMIGNAAAAVPKEKHEIPVIFFIFRDISSLTFVAVLSTVMKSTEQISRMQSRQMELESAMVEAELKSLKNQMNPHFLLNTLNNIYALSIINSDKTSASIMELSELLRYMLYENDKKYVLLRDEVNFIRNYIDLMHLRMTDNVTVSTSINIQEEKMSKIAPLILISLVENAFKHGVSNDEPSFVEIELTEKEDGTIYFLCRNSFFPKSEDDRSGSGIGLRQVRKRLELIYSHRYSWYQEVEKHVYTTELIINPS
ncbi:MAG: hypothetical protein BGO29_00370 [Bacteroidales bacterium 36-12]|nr:MAG: hypothetical protein BGO29_00370 [Bacteroidales bacterium 36-12]